ncbi:exosortase E/protease%2C VPEID-CTERM system [uncultured Roseburia sp.]|uniref:CPBP family intramembrane metalloprotease n=1 Tax=Brotonthovivens ammoniilytica TaxID=2981725 RepID=A0ABT2TGQ7_9FIRM|nr:type II CAAX endopeptidase family protein [Brotonthovivens ammoniilytica]MCU6760892.1 CPBP family intramembrane metalloprotease [Brotonthovivens ammoniilytica]SCI12463.1 exosortase E/protease%2C VPEID-CTERM system [uncultured Roseburia sp.]
MKDKFTIVKGMFISILCYALVTTGVYTAVTQLGPGTGSEHAMLAQTGANVLGLAVLLVCYRRGMFSFFKQKAAPGTGEALIWIVICVCASVVLNDFLSVSFLQELFPSWQSTETLMYSDRPVFIVLAACITGPAAEEFLYRGVVFQGLKKIAGFWPGVFLSAFVFGLLHMNPLQGFYAGILGLLFAFLYHRTGKLLMAVLAHALVNTISVVLHLTGLYRYYGSENTAMILISSASAAICLLLLWKQLKKYLKSRKTV